MIRQTKSASQPTYATLPPINVPNATASNAISTFGALDLMSPQPHASLPTASGVQPSRYGVSDRHALIDRHSLKNDSQSPDPLRQAFRDFVGQTLFGQLLSSMRNTVGKPAYFHGGRAEEVFTQQLDQVLVEQITEASASTVADPMYELFNLQRSQ